MLGKIKQQNNRHLKTYSNYLPNLRSRQFLLNLLRHTRAARTSASLKGAMGLMRWVLLHTHAATKRFAYRSACPVTGRSRGINQRFGISRTKIKQFSDKAWLLGSKKSSW